MINPTSSLGVSVKLEPQYPGPDISHVWNNGNVNIYSPQARQLIDRKVDIYKEKKKKQGSQTDQVVVHDRAYHKDLNKKNIIDLIKERVKSFLNKEGEIDTVVHKDYLNEYLEVYQISNEDPRIALRGQLGVQAAKEIKKGEPIGIYVGYYLSEEHEFEKHENEYGALNTRPYYCELGQEKRLLISGYRNSNAISLINANTTYSENEEPRQANLSMMHVSYKGKPYTIYVACETIEKGKELLVDYGPSYWKEKLGTATNPISVDDDETDAGEITTATTMDHTNNDQNDQDNSGRKGDGSQKPIQSEHCEDDNRHNNTIPLAVEGSDNSKALRNDRKQQEFIRHLYDNRSFARPDGLKTHQRIHTGEKPYACTVEGCDQRFSRSYDLKRHQRIHTGEKPYACTVEGCSQRFSRLDRLKAHQHIHTGEKPYVCTVEGCNRSFSDTSNRRKHIKVYHKKIKPYACTVEGCGKRFSYLGDLSIHKKVAHQVILSYACTIEGCSQSFDYPSRLKTHTQAVHEEKKPYECYWAGCNKRFGYTSHLKKHISAVHKSEKTYKCDWAGCDKFFSDATNLKKHTESIHKGEKPYQCPFAGCDKSFSYKHHLKRHKQASHESIKLYQCSFAGCDKHFSEATNLKKHTKSVHEGIKYYCPFAGCGKPFSNVSNLNRHKKVCKMGDEHEQSSTKKTIN